MNLPEPRDANCWYTASSQRPTPLPAIGDDLDCDVCIVGGGVTGVSAALHLAEQGLRVVLLEAREIGWASSGRNGGMMTAYADIDPAILDKALGLEHANRYWQLADRAQENLHEVVARYGIDCEIKSGALTAANTPEHFRDLAAKLPAFCARHPLRGAELLDAAQVRDCLGTDIYAGGVLMPRLPALHPLKLTRGLAEAAQVAGARLFENSRVSGYREEAGEVRVDCANGRQVRARHLLLASNAYLGDLVPQLSRRFVALYSSMVATAPLPEALARAVLKRDLAVLETQQEMRYYRLSGDNRLLFGGGGVMSGRDARVVKPLLTRMLRELFPQLREVPVEHVWGGWFGMTLFGDTPDVGLLSPRVSYAQAIPVVWAVLHGRLLAERLGSDSSGYDTLAGIDIPPGPGGLRLSLLLHQVGNLIGSVRSRLAS
ncbi:NAD(P)/FAD-dependent oxidoreductase [Pseudomonas citronellolis]|uniref:NAD(P)/FAD-dependent oxidoreductase n=1 Tax=Pseudomonas citronellolis TaxID=53408 RepID=UPI00209CE8AB|nr:FAD-binding oxidoreductase [Pseudomonas citronellolis]MCP1606013.1 gamma-glutamylputrescine oxidase [Pseudomonas citronellolis]MCP1656577.1 gamma-glutamylputrescine oxidase [Pseudomonas citronellolis]MCP1723606.1 gamma-glutamylputrescine oxidase [Pseudomonas citronellolis]